MSKSTSIAQTGLLAILLAMVGFSYSLATSNVDDASGEIAARAVGTNPPLAFANPFVTGDTDRDLGDAVAGSALTRLVKAKGGLAPYTFTAAGSAVNGNLVLTTLAAAQIQLLSNGILTTVGTQTSPSIPTGAFRFQVTVKDSFGTLPHSVTETFRLTFVSSTLFRFATSALSDGTQFRPYSDVAVTINGKGPIVYSLVSSTPAVTGLGVANDGAVYGVPIVSGTVILNIKAVDANGKVATARDGTGAAQAYTLPVTAGKSLASIISAASITIKTGFAKSKQGIGADGVNYKGVANLGAEAIASLSGKTLGLRIGKYVAPAVSFDGSGKANTAKGTKSSIVKASVKKFGLLGITVSKDTVDVGTISGATIQLPVEIRLGDAAIGTEFLTFAVKTSNKGGSTLTYKGSVSDDSGGSAQLLKVQGADDKAGTGDAWKAAFLGRFPASLLGSPTSVTVAIGEKFTNTLTVSNKNGKLTGKADRKSAVVSQYSLDTTKKGKGSFTTGVLPTSIAGTSAGTGIPQASKAPTTTVFFATTQTFSTGAGFDGSLAIFAKNKRWSSQ